MKKILNGNPYLYKAKNKQASKNEETTMVRLCRMMIIIPHSFIWKWCDISFDFRLKLQMKMLLQFCILQLSITINAGLVEDNFQNINSHVAEQPISIATTDSNWQIKPNHSMYCRPELKKCYIVLMQKQSWFNAELQCNAIEHKNGHLTSIRSHLENMHVFGFANLSDDYWIGGNYDNQMLFAWTDNTTYQYREWAPNIPINGSVADMCVAVAAGSDRLRTMWYNMSCKDEKFAVCEFDADENVTTNEFLKCDDGWIYYAFTNACYTVCIVYNTLFLIYVQYNATSSVTWDNAQCICEQNNANLTSIHSAEENDFVSGLAFDSNLVPNLMDDIYEMTWIGLRLLTTHTHRFSWIDGTPFNYCKWRNGEPNYDGECVELLTQSPDQYNRTWNDVDCATYMRSFVCKRHLITTTSSTTFSYVNNSRFAHNNLQYIRSYVAGRLELVETNSVIVEAIISSLSTIDRMHVNDANPVELIAQSDDAQKFWVINRQTTIGKCYDISDYLPRQQNAITITLAAFIDADYERKIAGCYESVKSNIVTCFVGNDTVGNWTNKHLLALRYVSSISTIEAVVTDNSTVYITRAKDIYQMMETNGTELTNVAFIALDQLALAFSVDHDMKQIFVCKLSFTRNRIECTVDKKMFAGNAQQLGFVTNAIGESNNNYTFMFIGNACFLQDTKYISSNAIFTENEIVALVTHEVLETFLFDRHQLIALSNDGQLRYINAGYRKTDDSNLLYASGSQLRAVAVPLQKIDDTNTLPCDRFTSNGINGNNSIVCTGKPIVTINNDSVIPFAVFNFDINYQLLSQTKLNLSLPKIVVESCQIAAIDQNNEVLAYCCKLASMIIFESINSSTNHMNADDFYVGYDFDMQKMTLILTVVEQKAKHFYLFVEDKMTNEHPISSGPYDAVSASVVKYNSILLGIKNLATSELLFYICFFNNDNIQFQILYTRIRFDNWMIPTSSQSPIDLPQYSFGIPQVYNFYRVTMVGLHSLPIKYLTVEYVNQTLAIMIGKSTIFQRYDNCSQFVYRHSIVIPIFFEFVYRQSIVTLLCCIDANHCGLIQFIVSNSSDAVISGYIPDDQNLCANGQGDGTEAECWTNGTGFLNTTRTMQMQTTKTTETKPAMTTKIGTMTTSTTATSPMTAVLTNTITKQFRSTTNVNDNSKSIPTSSEVIDGNHFFVFVRVGAIFLAAIVIVLLIFYRRRRMKSPRHTAQSNGDDQMIEMRSIRRMIDRRANRISDYERNTVPVANVETRRHETNVEYDDYM